MTNNLYNRSLRISETDYYRLSSLVGAWTAEVKGGFDKIRKDYTAAGHSPARLLWDIFWAVNDNAQLKWNQNKSNTAAFNDYAFFRGLSDRLTDNHIESALRSILL